MLICYQFHKTDLKINNLFRSFVMLKSGSYTIIKAGLYMLFGIIFGISLSWLSVKIYDQSERSFSASNNSGSDEVKNILRGNETLADFLYREVRVLCFVVTSPDNLRKKAIHVRDTWGKRCNKILFMTSPNNDISLETIKLNVTEGRNQLWAKTHDAFKYIYENHLEDADWFMKADDDTYVILENLRYLLYQYSTYLPIYFGEILKASLYMAGGSGYVLSKESLTRFYKEGVLKNKCQINNNNEDLMLGYCMKNLKVIAGDTRDDFIRERFFQFQPDLALPDVPTNPGFWYHKYTWFNLRYGLKRCCSDTLVSTHYVSPEEMYLYEYLIYRVKVNGGNKYAVDNLPIKFTDKNVMKLVVDGKVVNKFDFT